MEISLIITFVAIYFLPTFVGYKKNNFNAIFILNLLLGWTLIGWVVALVWASTKEKSNLVLDKMESKKSFSSQLLELKNLYDNGVLTRKEYKKKKKKLLER